MILAEEKILEEIPSINSLDSYKSNSNKVTTKLPRKTFCGRFSMVSKSSVQGVKTHLRVFCNVYGCKTCGKRKKFMVQKAIEKAMQEHRLGVFATLTLDPKSCRPQDTARYIKKLWNKHRTYQARYFSKAPSFISIVEFQKNGNAHLHVLFSHYVPWAWLDRTWKAIGGGHVDVRAADLSACRYVAKYLSKGIEADLYGKFRRVCTSRDIKLMAGKKRGDFEFDGASYFFSKSLNKRNLKDELFFGRELEKGFTVLDKDQFDVGGQLKIPNYKESDLKSS